MGAIATIFLGGGIGALTRHFSVMGMEKIFGPVFPAGTLFVNVVGSFVIGLLLESWALKWQVSHEMRAFIVTGFLGGFTTFSAFSFDVFRLAETGQAVAAVLYIIASVLLSIAAVFAGVFLIRGL